MLDQDDFDRWLDGEAGPTSKPFMSAFVVIASTLAMGLLLCHCIGCAAAIAPHVGDAIACDVYDCGEDDGSSSSWED